MTSNIHIFAKNTDATHSIRGYHYQILKTVETWLLNYLSSIKEDIYCEFEEDIFQLDSLQKTAKFRQIKLYSGNFSFSKDEIKKCLIHFFFLHEKTNYKTFDKEFIFEANSSIARKKGDNDADLLSKWEKEQDNLSGEILSKCVDKVKAILTSYINDESASLIRDNDNALEVESIKAAVQSFGDFTEDNWIQFVKSIKWKFDNTKPDDEIEEIKVRINDLLLKLPFSLSKDKDNLGPITGALSGIIWDKASAKETENKKVTFDELTAFFLESSAEKEKWYWRAYKGWETVTTLNSVIIGEFYELIDAVRFCKRKPILAIHDNTWLSLLLKYIELEEIHPKLKQTATYEYLWLKLRPVNHKEKPTGSLLNETKYIESYFRDFSLLETARELEDAQSLLNIVLTASFLKLADIDIDTVSSWFIAIEGEYKKRIEAETNINEKCALLEGLGAQYIFEYVREKSGSIETIEFYMDQLLLAIPKATFYNVSTLSERLSQYITLLIDTDSDDKIQLTDILETYLDKLNPYITQINGDKRVAESEVKRGIHYLSKNDPTLILKALNCFHTAKSKYLHQEFIEGYVLALINIGQIYSSIGLNIAAKYYAIGAAWKSIHNGTPNLVKRIPDAFQIVFLADFSQGSWFNAMMSYADYFNFRNEFESTEIDVEQDPSPLRVISDFAVILHVTPKVAPHLKVIIDMHSNNLTQDVEEFITPVLELLKNKYDSDEEIIKLIKRTAIDNPLNDVGPRRSVKFYALGSSWEISFLNDYDANIASEEFIGILQVVLGEIAFSALDFHFVKGVFKLDLTLSNRRQQPKQYKSNGTFKWEIFLETFDSSDREEIISHIVYTTDSIMRLLKQLSLLISNDFETLYGELFKNHDLVNKTLLLSSYQRMYRLIIKKDRFDILKRDSFDPIQSELIPLFKDDSVLKWNSGLSNKYNHEQAIQNIEDRFQTSTPCIHLTLNHLKKDSGFDDFIKKLRGEGWLDWQICLALANFLGNMKARILTRRSDFTSTEEYEAAYNRTFNEIRFKDEKDFYIELPLDALKQTDFGFHLKDTLVMNLNKFGLDINTKYPNFDAIREFLNLRLNMDKDLSNVGNPLI